MTNNEELSKIKEELNNFKISDYQITRLKENASDKKIFRIKYQNNSLIAIFNENISENESYFYFTNLLKEHSISVPQIFHITKQRKIYLIEDLGDLTLNSFAQENIEINSTKVFEYYCKALAKLHKIQNLDKFTDYQNCYQFAFFSEQNLAEDLELFSKYYLTEEKKYPQKRELMAKINNLKSEISFNPSLLMYRDFQTRNIMIKENELYFIDFQSARKGPIYYDLASFIFSSSTYLKENWQEKLLYFAFEVVKDKYQVSKENFINNIYLFAIMRLLQALGRYAYLKQIKGKNDFLKNKEEKSLRSLTQIANAIGEYSLGESLLNLENYYTSL